MDGRFGEAVETIRTGATVNTIVRVIAHVLLFIIAFVVFFLGLGVGLAFNPTLGTALWIASGAIAILNIIWIVKSMNAN